MTAPRRNTTTMRRVNRIFLRRSGMLQAFLIVLNNSDHLCLPTCSFDLLLCSFRIGVDLHSQLLVELAVGEDFHPVAANLHDAGVNQRLRVNDSAVLKLVEGTNVNSTMVLAKMLLKPLFGILLCRGIWPPSKPRTHARVRLLPSGPCGPCRPSCPGRSPGLCRFSCGPGRNREPQSDHATS